MKAALQLRQSQQLTLTPQLQQAIKLLQFSTLEVNQETARLLDENPFLEREEDDSAQPYAHGDAPASSATDSTLPSDHDNSVTPADWAELSFTAAGTSDDDEDGYAEVAADRPSMRDHLLWQVSMSSLNEQDKKLVSLLIDALDENGYLSQSLEEILALLPGELAVSLDDLETALVQLQYLDAPGIGARNLSECLSLQLRALPEQTVGRELALQITETHLDWLGGRDFSKLKKAFQCDDAHLRAAQELILHLHPKPGSAFEQRASDYVVPDVLVLRQGEQWQARLNPAAMPRLRVNQIYANILQRRDEISSVQMNGQLQEARWFIKNLQQRFDTILRVSQAIVARQHLYFTHGDIGMRPLVLREIADELGLHESTISRVTTQKYMLTPRGIVELKYFFGSGIATEAGGACSSTAIRALIKQLISEEDVNHPLTDSRLAEILAQQGVLVARRTVAKYRELLNILPVNLRKSL